MLSVEWPYKKVLTGNSVAVCRDKVRERKRVWDRLPAMSAVVCGKRSLFDDLHASPPNAKRIRCGGGSPIRFPSVSPASRSTPSGASEAAGAPANPPSPASPQQDPLSQLRHLFPDMDGQVCGEHNSGTAVCAT